MNSTVGQGDLLKKVYDKYINEDYTLGLDNLNPKREITKVDLDSIQEDENLIMSMVLKRLQELKSSFDNLPNYKLNTPVNNNDFVSNIQVMNDTANVIDSQLNAIALSGSTGPTIIVPGPPPGPGPQPIIEIIDDWLLKLTGLPPTDTIDPDDPDSSEYIKNFYDVNCDGFSEDITEWYKDNKLIDREVVINGVKQPNGGTTDNSKDNNSADSNNKNGNGNNNNGSGSGDDEENENNSADNTKNTADALAEAQEEAIRKAEEKSKESERTLKKCYILQLNQLKVILTMLKMVINLTSTAVQLMTVIVPIVRMIAFASQCWINPPAAAEAIQIIKNKIFAILMSMVGEILQLLWDALNLDCAVSQIQELIDEILNAITSVDNMINMGKSNLKFCLDATEEMANDIDKIKKSFSDEALEEAKKNWKNEFNSAKDELKKTYEEIKNMSPLDWGKKILESNSKIKNSIESVIRQAQKTYKQGIKSAKNITNTGGLNTSLSKAVAAIENLTVN